MDSSQEGNVCQKETITSEIWCSSSHISSLARVVVSNPKAVSHVSHFSGFDEKLLRVVRVHRNVKQTGHGYPYVAGSNGTRLAITEAENVRSLVKSIPSTKYPARSYYVYPTMVAGEAILVQLTKL